MPDGKTFFNSKLYPAALAATRLPVQFSFPYSSLMRYRWMLDAVSRFVFCSA